MHPLLSGLALTVALLATPALAHGQEPDPSTPVPAEGTAIEPQAPQPQPEAEAPEQRVIRKFFVDVGRDYAAWFTLDSTRTLIYGTATTMFLRPADEALTERGFPVVGEGLSGGQQYGNVTLQVPLAVGWWAIGRMAGSPGLPMPAATCCAPRSTPPASRMSSSTRCGGHVPTATRDRFPPGTPRRRLPPPRSCTFITAGSSGCPSTCSACTRPARASRTRSTGSPTP